MLIPSKHSGYLAGIRLYPGSKGGGSTQAPPPDPRLIEAQMRSMGFQDDAIQQIMKNANDLAPLQKEQLQFGLDSSKEAYKQSQDDRSWMLARRGILTQMQDKQVSDAREFNTEDRQNELAGKAGADVEQSFDGAQAGQTRNLARMGVTPDAGRALALGNQTAIAKADASVGARMQTRAQGRAEGYALTDRAAGSLAGYPAMGMQASGNGAGFGANGINMANAGLQGLNSGSMSAAGIAGQMGTNAGGMYGSMGNIYNQANQNANNSGNGFMGAFGTLGGAAITVF
jgi:hypothetical protein